MENYDPNNNTTEVNTAINGNTLANTVDSQITQTTNLYSNENIQSTTDQSVTSSTAGNSNNENTIVTGSTDSISIQSHVETSVSQSLTSDSNTLISSTLSASSASVIPSPSSTIPITSVSAISSRLSSSTVRNSDSISSGVNPASLLVSKSQLLSSSQSSIPKSSATLSDSSNYNSDSGLTSSTGNSQSTSSTIDSWNVVNPTATENNSTQLSSSSITSDTGINGLPYYTSIANGPKTINPFLSIYNAFSRNTTYLTGSMTSNSKSSTCNYLPIRSTTSNSTTRHSTATPVSSTSNHNYRNTTLLQYTTLSSSSSSSSGSSISQITDYTSSSSTTSEIPCYSYTQDNSAIYYIYTQQYDVTDSATSFTTGLPTTIIVSKQASQSQITTSFSIPQATITTNMSMFEKLLNGAIDGSSSSNDTESLPGNSSKTGTIVGSVVGSVGGITIAILLLLWFIRHKKRTTSNNHEYDKNFSHEIYTGQNYNATSRAMPSSPYNDESVIKTTRQDSDDSMPPPKFSVTNPFNNEFEMRRNRPGPPPPIPQPRKNMNVINNINTFYGPDRQSWLGNNNMTPSRASSSFISSSDSSFADDSTISLSSVRLGSRYDSPSNNDLQYKNSHPQGFFREII